MGIMVNMLADGLLTSNFLMYRCQEDKISQYEAWKEVDFKLRCEYRTKPIKLDMNHYATKYKATKTTFVYGQDKEI